jgi:hypothetical protein
VPLRGIAAYLPIGEQMMGLDYSAIREKTKKANHVIKKLDVPLTQKELDKIQYYIRDMEENILQLAEQGKDKFTYDCSKISEKMFLELATQFKQRNPLFFIVQQNFLQTLIVNWSGDNEV